MHGDRLRFFSSVFIIAQSDTRNREYLISWLQEISLEQLLFELGTFYEPLAFKDRYFLERTSLFYKSLLPVLTFVTCEVPYLADGFLHKLCPCFDILFAQSEVTPRNKFVVIVAVAINYCYNYNLRKK